MTIRAFQTRRFPLWIRRALNLSETNVPASLYSEIDHNGPYAPIQTTLDAFQGGIAIGDPIVVNTTVTVPAGPTPQFLDLTTSIASATVGAIPTNANNAYVVFAIALAVNAAATRNPFFFITPATPFASGLLAIAQPAITTAIGGVAWADMMHGGAPFFVPPGWTPAVYTNDLAAGEMLSVFGSLMRIPAGFKPY